MSISQQLATRVYQPPACRLYYASLCHKPCLLWVHQLSPSLQSDQFMIRSRSLEPVPLHYSSSYLYLTPINYLEHCKQSLSIKLKMWLCTSSSPCTATPIRIFPALFLLTPLPSSAPGRTVLNRDFCSVIGRANVVVTGDYDFDSAHT